MIVILMAPPYNTTLPVLPDELLEKISNKDPKRTVDIKQGFYGRWNGPPRTRYIFRGPTVWSRNDLGKKRRVSNVRRKFEHLKI